MYNFTDVVREVRANAFFARTWKSLWEKDKDENYYSRFGVEVKGKCCTDILLRVNVCNRLRARQTPDEVVLKHFTPVVLLVLSHILFFNSWRWRRVMKSMQCSSNWMLHLFL
ncbi:hypothetical protein H5410_005231 [Solanum commersonii]|uniref:Uncharacterized protein n=1 Tax=Solanum commersonii TaxID=4109 RepID=A0A9J6A630_SOLCO|nr:hypothetical protein H5410_005231 [Solanum commersonii]